MHSERRIVVGVGIEVAFVGPPTGSPTLVLLHEGLGSVSTWRDFPRQLSEATGHRVLVTSRAGYGDSDPVPLPRPLSYMEDEAHGPLPALLDALALDDVVLVGHSDGASIALVYAATAHAAGRLRGLVLEAPHVFCEDRSVEAIERTKDQYLHGDLRRRLARHHHDVDVAFWGWNRAWLDPSFRRFDLQRFLPGVRVPTLLVQADDDPYGTLAQLDAIERGVRAPVVRHVLTGGGHAPHRERTAEVLPLIATFVAGLPPSGR